MSSYRAPLEEIEFVIRHLARFADIAAYPAYSDVTDDVAAAVLGEAARFAQDVLDPLNAPGDREGARLEGGEVRVPAGFAQAYRKFVDAGWNAISGSRRYGGQGLPQVVAAAVQEMWNSANLSFCLAPMLTSGVVRALEEHGSPSQQASYLPKLTSGEWCGTMELTEAQAGSDLSALRMLAVPEDDHHRLRGTKVFITWGEHDMAQNIVHLVLARTPDAPEGVKGISLFIVPKFLIGEDGARGPRNDITCVSVEHKLGIHASPTCMLAYGEHGGAIGYLVGERHRGLEYMFTTMNHARLAVGLEGVGLAERAWQRASAYAQTRIQGREIGERSGDRVPIVRHPDVQRMLLTMKAQTEAMRALAYYAASAIDRAHGDPDAGERQRQRSVADLLTPVVKGWCTEQAIDIASIGIQIHGGMGYIEESGAAQHLRDARITAIYEGTTGIQANDLVGRKLARDRGAVANAFISNMLAVDGALARSKSAEVERLRAPLARAITALRDATQAVVAADPRRAAAVAVPYLKLFGTVAGGWMMACAALAACDEPPSASFTKNKIVSASLYAHHVLPLADALAAQVRMGADSVLAFDDDMLATG